MASSGSRRNDDPERARCVRSDAARKRADRRYTQWGLTPPPSLLRRETEEYDRARGCLFSGSSFEASSSRSSSSLPPVKRELGELPSVKMEPEAEAVPERRVGVVVGPEDFFPPAEANNLLPMLLAQSAREAEEDQQRRRREEIDTVLYEQGVASASPSATRWRSGVAKRMDKIVNIHYVDKEAFMNIDIVDSYEEELIFLESPTSEEVVEETRIRLKWVDPSDQVELLRRYDVGTAHKCRMKTMCIKSNLHWVTYKEVVASSVVKSFEVFASKVVRAPLFHVDLNQPLVHDLNPISSVPPIVQYKVEVEVNEYPQYEFGDSAPIKDDGHNSDEEYERHHNYVGDVDAQVRHDEMDPDIVYQRACVDESDDEGPVNELDEDGFTEKEAECYTKITRRDHKVPLFCDVSLADKAIIDGGMSKTIEARVFPSSTPDAISTSYLKKGLMFEHMLEFKMCLCEYVVKHYMPFIVVHSDCNKQYTVKCEVEKCK
ncbi:hypothetical protein D1007_44581 [Hordeum vulgare]|nr:hypothetical protein D1007_44581 [Hordeum vulgare]